MGKKNRSPNNSNKTKRKRRRKKKGGSQLMMVLLFFFITAGCAGYVAYYLLLPSNDYKGYQEYYNLPQDEITVVQGDLKLDLDAKPKFHEGSVCFPVEFVREYLDPYIYWDGSANKLTITMPDKVLRFLPGETNYYENGNPVAVNVPVFMIDGGPYLPSDLLAHIYHVSFDYNMSDKIVTFNRLEESLNQAAINYDQAALRFLPDKKAPIMYKLSENEIVDVFGESDEYARVRALNGMVGYVLSKYVSAPSFVEGSPADPPVAFPVSHPINGKINLIWDQVANIEANSTEERRAPLRGLNVLAPTWFTFDLALDGYIVSLADVGYVDWAHSQGYQVWGLLSDILPLDRPENINNQDATGMILSDTDKREYVIKQLLEFIAMYGLDGINIDFEFVQKENAENYLQFFRELSPYMKAAGAILSVDMYCPVPENHWSKYYNREEVAKAVDYVCIMAYDENISSIGPNASLPFVRNGLGLTLEEVPNEKIVLGLPYYVRVWTESNGGVSSREYGMEYAEQLFNSPGATKSWDDAYGTYDAKYMDNAGSHRAWLEDARSLEQKLMLINEFGLAGVGGWRRGLESGEAWSMVLRYVG